MSEPYDPVPVDHAPRTSPAAEPWTILFAAPENARSGRRVVVFARNWDEAAAQAPLERKPGERLVNIERGGRLSQAWSDPK